MGRRGFVGKYAKYSGPTPCHHGSECPCFQEITAIFTDGWANLGCYRFQYVKKAECQRIKVFLANRFDRP